MATEILVNDGGAPARILPFVAGSTISAGLMVSIASDGEVDYASSGATSALGTALTAATSGNIANIITGHGVMLNVSCSTAVAFGDSLEIGDTTGALQPVPSAALSGNSVAVALESGSGFLKVLTR